MQSTRAFLLVSLLSLGAWGEASNPLTWQDAVRLAARNNPDLISALWADGGESRPISWKLQRHPTASHPFQQLYRQLFASAGESKLWQAQGSASLDLIDFGQWATIQSASASLKQSQANLEVAGTTALLNLYKSFAACFTRKRKCRSTQTYAIFGK